MVTHQAVYGSVIAFFFFFFFFTLLSRKRSVQGSEIISEAGTQGRIGDAYNMLHVLYFVRQRDRERKKEEKKGKESLTVPVFTATILACVASFGQCIG